MSNKQSCDGSRPACDAAMAQLAAAQARADAANDALLDTVADLARYQVQSAEFERDYERELKRAESAEQRIIELEKERDGLQQEVEFSDADYYAADAQLAAAQQRIAELEKERDARMSRVHKFMDILGPLAQVGEMEWDTVRRLVAERDAETARADAVEASLAALHEAYGDAREEFGFQWDRAWYNERLRADALAQQVAELRDALRAIVSDDPHHVAVYLQASGITETFDGYAGKDIWAIAQDALARLDAQKETTMDDELDAYDKRIAKMVEAGADDAYPFRPPPAVPAPTEGPYRVSDAWDDVILDSKGKEVCIVVSAARDDEDNAIPDRTLTQRIADALNAQAELRGLLQEISVMPHNSASHAVLLTADLYERIRKTVEEATDAPVR